MLTTKVASGRPGAAVLICALAIAVVAAPMNAFAACDVKTAKSEISFSQTIQPLLHFSCALATCHIQPDEAQDLVLNTGKAYLWLVNVPSFEVRMKRVEPGDPEASYLVHKLRGTHHEVGGEGERMPFQLDPFTQDQVDLIVTWIKDCSPDN